MCLDVWSIYTEDVHVTIIYTYLNSLKKLGANNNSRRWLVDLVRLLLAHQTDLQEVLDGTFGYPSILGIGL
jgi:hypothetical protein